MPTDSIPACVGDGIGPRAPDTPSLSPKGLLPLCDKADLLPWQNSNARHRRTLARASGLDALVSSAAQHRRIPNPHLVVELESGWQG